MVRSVRVGPSEPAAYERDPPTRIGGDRDDNDRPMAFAYRAVPVGPGARATDRLGHRPGR